jgi:ABC-type proline/glycine betaine transport system permease subunit
VLSNWKYTEKTFNWVTSCIIIGLVIGLAVGNLIAETYK